MSDVSYYGSDRAARMARARVQERWQNAYAPVRHIDPVLILVALGLTGLGLVMIYSATSLRLELSNIEATFFVRKQIVALVVGVIALVVVAAVDYRWVRSYSPLIYVGAITLLVAVFTVAIGCVVVHIMKGPAYVADSLPVSHADQPKRDERSVDE